MKYNEVLARNFYIYYMILLQIPNMNSTNASIENDGGDVTTLLTIGKYVSLINPPVLTLLSVGNIVSLLVFVRSDMRKAHTNVYLAALAVVDTVWVNTSTWCYSQEIAEGKEFSLYSAFDLINTTLKNN